MSIESKEMATLLYDAVNRLIEAKLLPNKLLINTPVSTSSKAEETSSALMGVSLDTTFYKKVMADANIDCFAEMDHINRLVEIYEKETPGNNLVCIKHSINGKFWVYQPMQGTHQLSV